MYIFKTNLSSKKLSVLTCAPYLTALDEGKPPPPNSKRQSKKKKLSPSTGAAYFDRRTLVLTSKFFEEHFGQANLLNVGHRPTPLTLYE